MAQNNNQNGAQTAPTTQSKAIAAMKDELANSVLRRIEELPSKRRTGRPERLRRN